MRFYWRVFRLCTSNESRQEFQAALRQRGPHFDQCSFRLKSTEERSRSPAVFTPFEHTVRLGV
jgi:hypothetical protein